jgi:uncharacterized protein (TIGR02246 family)
MSKGRTLGALLAGALLASGCGRGGAPPPTRPVAADPAAEIAAEEDQWNRDYAARDLDRLAAHYAPDATLKESGVPPLTGRWIRKVLEGAVTDPAFTLSFAHDRIEVARAGDIGYSRGHYRMTFTDQQSRQPTTEYGSYLTIWRRQADGRWKVQEGFVAPGPAPRLPM